MAAGWDGRLGTRNREAVVDPDPELDALEKCPEEMWAKILSHCPSLEARLVCKTWWNVISKFVGFKMTLDDRERNFGRLGSVVTVDRCVVNHLTTDNFSPKILFRDSGKLRELLVRAPITPSNFEALIREFPNLVKLTMIDVPLKSIPVDLPVSKLTSFTFIWFMAGGQSDEGMLSGTIFEWISRMDKLTTLNMQGYKYLINSGDVQASQFTTSKPLVHLRNVKLTTSPLVLTRGLPFLKLHNQLRNFRIIEGRPPEGERTLSADLFNELCYILTLNQNTLTVVELTNYVPSHCALDCALFENMNQLKELVLQRRSPVNDVQLLPVHITNLKLLPKSLEILSLTRLWCDTADLNLMADRLDNIKSVKLVSVGKQVHTVRKRGGIVYPPTGVSQQTLEKLTGKSHFKDVFISPVVEEKFTVIQDENNMKYISVNGIVVELQTDYYGTPYIKFHSERASNQHQE